MTAIAGARITGEARLEMAAVVGHRYGAGEAIRAIALDLGRSYGFVQQLLVEAEVPLRTRGGDTRSPAARARREQNAQILAELAAQVEASEAHEAPEESASRKKSRADKAKKSAKKPDAKKPDAKKPDAKKSEAKKSEAKVASGKGKHKKSKGKKKSS